MESWSCTFSIAANLDAISWPRIHSMCLMAECKYTKSISSSAQYVSLQKYFSHPSLVIYFLSNLAPKIQIGTANRWETTDSKLHWPIIVIGRSKTGSNSQIIFITLFSARC
jgi:hypothetical protein